VTVTDAVLAFSIALTVVVAALVSGVTYLLFKGPIGRPDLFGPALALLGGFIVATNTSWNLDMVFAAFRAGRQLFWIRLLQAVSFMVLATVAGLYSDTVWSLVLATIGSYATGLAHRVIAVRMLMRSRVELAELREGFRTLPMMIRFGLKIAPSSLADGISKEAGTWTLGLIAPIAVVGAYNRAWQLGRRFTEMSHQMTEMLFPTLVRRRSDGERDAFDRALLDSVRYSTAALLLPAAVGGGAAHAVMAVFGPGFGQAADALAVILVLPALSMTSAIFGSALLAADRPLLTTAVTTARMVVTVGFTIALTLWIGLTGTAIALLLGYLTDLAWITQSARAHVSRPFRELWPFRSVLVTIGAYAVGFAVARALDTTIPGVTGLLLALAGGSLAYIAFFLLAGGPNERDWDRLRSIRNNRAGQRGYASAHPHPMEAAER